MPGCVLRASGSNFDVQSFLSESTLAPAVIYKKGQRRKPASRGSQTASGFNVIVCGGEESMQTQVTEALAFLEENREELERLHEFRGLEELALDFACPQGEIASRSARLPADLLAAAGGLGIDIHLSFYLVG